MRKTLNPWTSLFALGVVQPATPNEIVGFLRLIFHAGGELPQANDIQDFLRDQIGEGHVVAFAWQGSTFYSLTVAGNRYIPRGLRKLRDKLRAYLLKDAHRRRLIMSRTGDKGLAGGSPAADTSRRTEARAAKKPSRQGQSVASGPTGPAFWPRFARQFHDETGPKDPVRDTLPPLISYPNSQIAAVACGLTKPLSFDSVGLGTCLGLSPALVYQMAQHQSLYYRTFDLRKKGGGKRRIETPRVFLKVIQWFLSEFIFGGLKVSSAVHSFRRGKSIISNAQPHEQHKYVANMDIHDFFGSIKPHQIELLLRGNGFGAEEAKLLARLVTCEDRLPQGAPTSPPLSNALLYDFDQQASSFCKSRRVTYSRYADDITMSGKSRSDIVVCMRMVTRSLRRIGFELNHDKTRVAGVGGQQRVTGVVVNVTSSPPRMRTRRIRAIFHQAELSPDKFAIRIPELAGHLGYLAQFPKFAHSAVLEHYRTVLRAVSGQSSMRKRRTLSRKRN